MQIWGLGKPSKTHLFLGKNTTKLNLAIFPILATYGQNFIKFAKYLSISGGKRKKYFFARSA